MASEPQSVVGRSTRVDHETDEPDESSSSRPDWLGRGQTIGRYLVLECLGIGGMGVVYSAWDPKLDRKLAIKVVRGRHGRLGSPRGRARLLREGQALARLRHPNVITVHDVGTHEGRVFVAMEFVEGETLYHWLQRSPRPVARHLIDVFLQVGRGLAAAHRAGLVHRDVKPENVMIGDDGRVMVLDFGIARDGELGDDEAPAELDAPDDEPEVARERADEQPHEHDEPLAIEPEATPERPHTHDDDEPDDAEPAVDELLEAHGRFASLTRSGAVIGTPAYMSPEQHRGLPLDARSDQFSFCVAMWEALNGEKPYGDGSRQKLLARMRLGQLRAFHNREIPRRMVVALRRGLSWNPRDRFPSMEALLEALNPRSHGTDRQLWHGLAIGALGGMLIGVVATLMSFSLRSAPAPELASREHTELEHAQLEPADDPKLLTAAALNSRAAGERLAELRNEIDRLEQLAELDSWREHLEHGRMLLAAAREARDPSLLARVLLVEGRLLARAGQQTEAEALLLEAARVATIAGEARLQARALIEAASSISVGGDQQQALRWLELAAAVASTLDDEPPLRLAILHTRAGIAHRQGRCDEAWDTLTRAVELARADVPASLLLAGTLESFAEACESSHADAPALAREAVELRERLQGPTHPELAHALAIEALTLLAKDDAELALSKLDRAAGILAAAGATPQGESFVLAVRGLTLATLGRHREARTLLERAGPGLERGSALGLRVAQVLAQPR